MVHRVLRPVQLPSMRLCHEDRAIRSKQNPCSVPPRGRTPGIGDEHIFNVL